MEKEYRAFLQFDLNIVFESHSHTPARSLPTQVLWYSTVIEKLLLYCILFLSIDSRNDS